MCGVDKDAETLTFLHVNLGVHCYSFKRYIYICVCVCVYKSYILYYTYEYSLVKFTFGNLCCKNKHTGMCNILGTL